MEQTKNELLRDEIYDVLDTLLRDCYGHFSGRDLIDVILENQHGGFIGYVNMTDEQLLQTFKDELDNFEDDEAFDEFRDLAARFEMELAIEKELLV